MKLADYPSLGNSFSIIEIVETYYDGTDTIGVYRNFASELTVLLSSSALSRTKFSVHITAKQVKTYYLDNDEQWLYGDMRSEDVQKRSYCRAVARAKGLDVKLAMPISSVSAALTVVACGDPAGSGGRAKDW
ncbi:hypothetical protein N7510_011371 [Penicillium lagena]|uniref:uncharacterized protein n=1 Tax=Penicillium lagena TaxID=94218 RepID=UPI00253F921C|nr:uncharacterized protein N7510_011371 [Penicillium lagena]KAJ5601837.1 hypothetical protein N7510_011371 [Penicillium lagena]